MASGWAHAIRTWPLAVMPATSTARTATAIATPIQMSRASPRKPRHTIGRCSTNLIHNHSSNQTPENDARSRIVEV